MKNIVLAVIALSILPISAFADCRTLAERAAQKFAESTTAETIAWDVGGSRLKQSSGSRLIYEVEMRSSYTDGASTEEFPSQIFVVRATGNSKVCRITGVKTK